MITEVRRHQPSVPWHYSHLDFRQREVAEKVRQGGEGSFLLSEVAPVITQGRRTPSSDLLGDLSFFTQKGIEVHATDRGGLATYHGPGQWLLFPVFDLETLTGDRRGVRKGVRALLEIAWEVGREFVSDVEVREGCELGVWTPRGKFAAVGIHIEKGVLLHGLAVNGYRTETSFVGLRPCGLDAPVDFLLEGPNEAAFLALGNQILHRAQVYFKIDERISQRYNTFN